MSAPVPIPKRSGGSADLDEELFEELSETLDKARLLYWIGEMRRMIADMQGQLSDPQMSLAELGTSAHAVISRAGIVGMMRLAVASREFETACHLGRTEDATGLYMSELDRAMAVIPIIEARLG